MHALDHIVLTIVLSTLAADYSAAQEYTHKPVWELTLGGRINSIKILNDSMIVGYEDNVECISLRGKPKWRFTAGNMVNSVQTYGDRLIVSSTDHFTYMLTKEGTLLWKTEIPGYVGYDDAVDARDGRMVVGSVSGNTSAYDANGHLTWEYHTGGYVLAARIIGEDTLIVSDKEVFLLDKNGMLKTKFNVNNYIRTASIDNKSVVLGLSDGAVLAYSTAGRPLWSHNTKDQIGVVKASDSITLAGLRNGMLIAFGEDGKIKYSVNLNSSVISVNTNGVYAIAGTLDNRLVLVGYDGRVKWHLNADSRLLTTYIDSDNIVAGGTAGKVYYTKTPSRTPSESFVIAAVTMSVIIVALMVFIRAWERD